MFLSIFLDSRYRCKSCKVCLIVLVLMGAYALVGCRNQTSPASDDAANRPYVTTSIPAVSHIVRGVLGNEVEIVTILNEPASPHGYELRPSDARTISNSVSLIAAADGVDDWVGDIAGTPKFMLFERDGSTESTWNPHGWTDPVRVQASLPDLTVFLCDVIPDSCPIFRTQSAEFSASLESLTDSLQTVFTKAYPSSFVTTEPFFDPYLKRFSISVIDVLRPVPAHDPSPAALRRILNASPEIDAIIVQSIHRDPLALELASDQGWKVVYIDPLGLAYPDFFTYMRSSADSLLNLLQD